MKLKLQLVSFLVSPPVPLAIHSCANGRLACLSALVVTLDRARVPAPILVPSHGGRQGGGARPKRP